MLTFYAFKRYILGAIVGLLYHIRYSEWNLPNPPNRPRRMKTTISGTVTGRLTPLPPK